MPDPTRFRLPAPAAAVVFSLATTALAAQNLEVRVAGYHQAWRGAGVALPADLDLLADLAPAARAEVFARGAGDLALGYLYDCPSGHPAARPDDYARRTGYVQAILAEAPGAEVVLGLEHFPASLRADTTIDGQVARRLDTRRAGIYGEVADWYQAVLTAYAEAGVPVAMVSLATAADRDAEEQGVHRYGVDADARKDVARLYHLAVDSLRARLADPDRNPSGVPMPGVLAPNGSSPVASSEYLNYMRGNVNRAWLNVTAVGIQQVESGSAAATTLQSIVNISGERPVLTTQALANRGDNLSSYPAFSRGHRGALSLMANFATALNNGMQSFAYDQIAVADAADETGLLVVGSGSVEAPLRHAAFRQLTAAQRRGDRRLSWGLGTTLDLGLRVAALRREGGDTVVVHVGNYSGPRTINIDLRELDGGAAYATTLARHVVTDSTRAAEEVAFEYDTTRVSAFAIDLAGFSVNTLTFAIPGSPADTTGTGGGTDTTGSGGGTDTTGTGGGTDTTGTGGGADTTGTAVVDPAPDGQSLVLVRAGDELAVGLRGSDRPLRDVGLLDLQGRRVARAEDAGGDGAAILRLADLPRGVYVVTATVDGRRIGRSLVW